MFDGFFEENLHFAKEKMLSNLWRLDEPSCCIMVVGTPVGDLLLVESLF